MFLIEIPVIFIVILFLCGWVFLKWLNTWIWNFLGALILPIIIMLATVAIANKVDDDGGSVGAVYTIGTILAIVVFVIGLYL